MNNMNHSFERVNHLQLATPDRPTYVAVGVFDGVHRGHQKLLSEMVAAAHIAQARPAVLTFSLIRLSTSNSLKAATI